MAIALFRAGDSAIVNAVILIVSFITTVPSLQAENPKGFGLRQVEQVLEDRPSLAAFITAREQLRAWMARQFNGEATGSRIYWDDTEPSTGRKSEYMPRFYAKASPGCVRLAKDASVSSRDKTVLLIFELVNIENTFEVKELAHSAAAGELNSDEFFRMNAKLEFEAIIKTQKQLAMFLPASEGDDVGRWEAWIKSVPQDFDEYFDAKKLDDSYRQHFLRSFRKYRTIGRAQTPKPSLDDILGF